MTNGRGPTVEKSHGSKPTCPAGGILLPAVYSSIFPHPQQFPSRNSPSLRNISPMFAGRLRGRERRRGGLKSGWLAWSCSRVFPSPSQYCEAGFRSPRQDPEVAARAKEWEVRPSLSYDIAEVSLLS